ncbi:hypothetical protein AB0F81_28095 [Actinoplanes sp. NPDC024001]|uniref:hypothetical protein n=1 Tax=Actinoplanes sp. NPDC024001 TaxID=3154598 RepID=UPI003407C1EB
MPFDLSRALPRWVWAIVGERRPERAQPHAEAVEAKRYADELSVAAVRAGEAAERWRAHWQQADQHAAEAWQAWQDAEQRLARTRAAAAFRPAHSFRTPAEFADRERFLPRALAAAVARGDLPATVLGDLAAGAGGWNPRLHPVEQELVVHRAVAAVRHHWFQQAVAAEQAAWHDAQLAATARDSLRREAWAAAERAAALHRHAPGRESRVAAARRPSWVQQTA